MPNPMTGAGYGKEKKKDDGKMKSRDSYLKSGMKEQDKKVKALSVMAQKAKAGKKAAPSKERVNYPFGSVPKNDPFVKNQSDFLKKMQKMNKDTMKKLDTSKKLKKG